MPGDEPTTPLPDPVGPQSRVTEEATTPLVAGASDLFSGLPAAETPISHSSRVPLRIGQYEIIKELGRGGMGIVFLAKQPSLNREVALKVMNTGFDTSAAELKRFRAEAQMAAQLHHPNIVQVFEVGEQDGLAFLAMEHIEGGSLHQYLSKKQIAIHDAVDLLEPLARAMHYAHLKGIVHRDLKPANVLLVAGGGGSLPGTIPVPLDSPSGQRDSKPPTAGLHPVVRHPLMIPKITDFGLAKRINQSVQITATGVALGTPSYMAPEQARDERSLIGPVSDVYSLGAILYEMLTGQPPFTGSSPLSTLERVVRDRPVPPRRLRAEIPSELERICLKCLEKKPQNRYPNAEALADDLRQFLVASEVTAAVQANWNFWRWIKQRPTLAVGFLGVIVFLIALTFYKLREGVAAADKIARDVQLRAQLDQLQAEQEKLSLLQRGVPLVVQRGISLCDRGEIEQGFEWLTRAQSLAESAQAPAYDRTIRANMSEWNGQRLPILQTMQHPGGLLALAFRPDGTTLASGGRDGTIRFWNPSTGMEEGNRLSHPRAFVGGGGREVKLLTWGKEGRTLYSASEVPYGYHWNFARREAIGEPWDLVRPPSGLLVSRDGGIVIASVAGETIHSRSTTTGKDFPDLQLPGKQGNSTAIALSHDGRILATAGSAGELRLWEKKAETWVTQRTVSIGFSVLALTFIGEQQRLAIAGRDGKLWVWEPGLQWLRPLPTQESDITCVVSTPDGRRFITGTAHGVVRVWDAMALAPIGPAVIGDKPVMALSCRPDNAVLAIGEADGTIRIHQLPLMREAGPRISFERSDGNDSGVRNVQLSQDGRWLLTATATQARLWDSRDLALAPRQWEPVAAQSSALSPDGRFLAFGGSQGKIELIEIATGRKITKPPTLQLLGDVRTVIFSPDSRRLILLGANGKEPNSALEAGSWVWEYPREKAEAEAKPKFHRILAAFAGEVLYAVGHPDGRRLIFVGSDRKVHIWDMAADQPTGTTFQHGKQVSSLAVNGSRLATGCRDGTVHLWNLSTGEELLTMPHGGEIGCLAFSPDGLTLLSGSSDGSARFWHTTTGLPIGPALRHADAVLSVGFRSDGKIAVTGSRDGTAQLWKWGE